MLTQTDVVLTEPNALEPNLRDDDASLPDVAAADIAAVEIAQVEIAQAEIAQAEIDAPQDTVSDTDSWADAPDDAGAMPEEVSTPDTAPVDAGAFDLAEDVPTPPCEPAACDDGNPCTQDACDVANACTHKFLDGAACSDGSACTQDDACQAGACKGQAIACDDSQPCTLDGCDPAKGCTHTDADGVACDDGASCTQGDACLGGACKGGPSICGCQSQAECDAQDDGNPCNGKLFCDQTAMPWTCKIPPGSAVVCVASGPCTTSACDAKTGLCVGQPIADGTACDADNSPCTAGDHCQGGSCVAGSAKVCNDGNPCTQDSCDAKTGQCAAQPQDGLACDDGDACTTGEQCGGGKCLKGSAISCTDGNVCTADACAPSQGCSHVPLNGACNDGSMCTSGDSCQGGTCQGGAVLPCDDADACTADGCDPAQGCTHTAIAGCSPMVSFAMVDAKVVQPYCVKCHGSFVYKTLLIKTLPSTSPCATKKFVVSGQPLQSLWYQKLDPNVKLTSGCGNHMPDKSPALSPVLVKLVYDWIAGGAKP